MHTVEEIKIKLGSDKRWAMWGLEVLWNYQTPKEKMGVHTNEINGVGLNRYDAPMLGSFAKQVRMGRILSSAQVRILFRRMPKYAGQLHRKAYGG